MNEEYLWSKIGGDDEIERLESALKPLRYSASEPPAISAAVVTEPASRFISPWSFRLRLAWTSGLCAAVFVTAVGGWLQISDRTGRAATDSVRERVAIAYRVANDRENAIPDSDRSAVRSRRSFAASFPDRRKTPRPALEPKLKLSPEELEAYEQLMLALSITGSKLKIVKDKVNGSDE